MEIPTTFPKRNLPTQIPPAVTQLTEWPNVPNNSKFDSILSIGNLASEPDLPQLLLELKHHLTHDSKLYFCERTKSPMGTTGQRNMISAERFGQMNGQ